MNKDWLDIELLEDYLNGNLDGTTMHQIEKRALEDPFVEQALAGLAASPKRASQNISLLQRQLYERIGQQHAVKKDSLYTWQRLSIAAAAAVMFITVSTIYFMREEADQARIAKLKDQPKNIEVTIAPPLAIDSVKNEAYANTTPLEELRPVGIARVKPTRKTDDIPEATTAAADLASSRVIVATMDTLSDAAQKLASPAIAAAKVTAVLPSASEPVGGWANLLNYMKANNKLLQSQHDKFVELSFLIDSNGNPIDIKVEKGASPEYEAEALRLIKEGPKWEQPKTAGSRMSYAVTF